MRIASRSFWLSLGLCTTLLADGPADNQADKVRPVPPPGVVIADTDRRELEAGVAELGREIDSAREAFQGKAPLLQLLPDVQIFHNAVRYALTYNEIFNPTNEVAAARTLLQQGKERLAQLREGKAPWTNATGLIVRGYVSKLDGSVQPYGLVVPESFAATPHAPHRLDFWFHGRDERLSELNFLSQRQKSPGEFVPPNAFVLHTYGRYCNGQKLAGEVDLFEALDAVKKSYPIDENRLVVRGFSLGGAACWHYAVHHAGLWAAAAPGAGFSETPDFLKVFQSEKLEPSWYEQKLWHLYDCTDYAVNLFNCPTVAYSGEIDKQKQAADVMAKALKDESMELTHIIGPQTAHKYHPDSKTEINRRIDSIVAQGRNPVPRTVKFTTWTLRYNQMLWVTVDGLEQHWERARVEAEIVDDHTIQITTKNVTGLTLDMPSGLCPLDNTVAPTVIIDGRKLTAPAVASDRSWSAHFTRDGRKWATVDSSSKVNTLQKQHGLQGPIDDAFMDSFLMVRPTGQPFNAKTGAWATGELDHALKHWRQQYRGEARVKNDSEVTEADIAEHNLILWGDPQSNQLLAKMLAKLPVQWTPENVTLGKKSFSSSEHVPVLIYPNPLNPKRYVVLNSGFTFREYDYLNNARQVPKLPDYAIVDLKSPVTSRYPGDIVDAGFFNEQWQFRAAKK